MYTLPLNLHIYQTKFISISTGSPTLKLIIQWTNTEECHKLHVLILSIQCSFHQSMRMYKIYKMTYIRSSTNYIIYIYIMIIFIWSIKALKFGKWMLKNDKKEPPSVQAWRVDNWIISQIIPSFTEWLMNLYTECLIEWFGSQFNPKPIHEWTERGSLRPLIFIALRSWYSNEEKINSNSQTMIYLIIYPAT